MLGWIEPWVDLLHYHVRIVSVQDSDCEFVKAYDMYHGEFGITEKLTIPGME